MPAKCVYLMIDEHSPTYLQQTLGPVVGQRTKPAADPGCKNDCLGYRHGGLL
jgi:hypothetical protein